MHFLYAAKISIFPIHTNYFVDFFIFVPQNKNRHE